MNLVQRYIQAVKIELPPAQREDIGRELHCNIQDDLEALAQQHQRPPSEAEVGAYLQRLGPPVRVASTYWPRRSLGSEAAYPLYKQALILGLSLYVAIGVVLALTELGQARVWGVLLFPRILYDIASSVLFGFFAITVVFHYFGNWMAAQPFFWRFDPRRLPNLESGAYLPRTQTMGELLGTVFGLSLVTVGSLGFQIDRLTLDFSPVGGVLAGLQVLLLLAFGLNLLNLLQPYWTRSKLMVRLLVGLGVGFALVQLLLMPQLVVLSGTPASSPAALNAVNWSLKASLGVWVGVLVWTEAQALRRLLPLKLPWF